MKKSLRSRIRALECPLFEPEQGVWSNQKLTQRCYAEGFDLAVQRVLEYVDNYTPLPEMLFDYTERLRGKQVADIRGDGRASTIVSNAGFVLACNKMLKLIHDEHSDEIERARAVRRSEDDDSF